MAIAMVALLAFGGTYAYFTATAKTLTSDGIVTGHIKLTTSGEFVAEATAVLPGDSLLKDGSKVTITPDASGTEGEYVAVKLTLAIAGNPAADIADLTPKFATVSGAEWVEVGDDSGIYVLVDSTNKTNAKAITGATDFITDIIFVGKDHHDGNNTESDYTSDHEIMDVAVTVTIEARGIQVANNTDNNTAEKVAALFTTVVVAGPTVS